jgi:GNAT superfamily N-acetyltransferase
MMKPQIVYLKHYQEYITALSQWSFETWSKYHPNATRKGYIEKLKGHCQIDALPLTLIALNNGEPIGMCSLRSSEDIRPDLTPWLSSLYVVPSCRHQQVGQCLIDAIKRIARSMGFETLYLLNYEPSLNNYFVELSWVLIGSDYLNNYPISIMETTLN